MLSLKEKTMPGMGVGKGEWLRGVNKVWYIWYIARTFVNGMLYPHQAH
jgi:hypothetical protein